MKEELLPCVCVCLKSQRLLLYSTSWKSKLAGPVAKKLKISPPLSEVDCSCKLHSIDVLFTRREVLPLNMTLLSLLKSLKTTEHYSFSGVLFREVDFLATRHKEKINNSTPMSLDTGPVKACILWWQCDYVHLIPMHRLSVYFITSSSTSKLPTPSATLTRLSTKL